jgi:hypothetical protein
MNIKEYLKEVSIVILGIIIAFWLTNLGSNYKDRATQKQVLRTILSEIKENCENAKTTEQSLDSLSVIYNKIKNKNIYSDSITINYEGLRLRSIGYETAKYTGILKDVNYDLTSKIVENYESQNSLISNEKMVIDELFLSIKNKMDKSDNIDYLLLQIGNLTTNLKDFEVEQKNLIEILEASLKVKS